MAKVQNTFRNRVAKFRLLQYSYTALNFLRCAYICFVIYRIIIDIVVVNGAINPTVPAEMLVGGGKHHLAPTVEDTNLETIVVDIIQKGFRQAEIVVKTVAIGREGVGHQNLPVAMRKGVLSHCTAFARGCRNRINTRFVNRYKRACLASTPEIVVHSGDHLQGGTAIVAEIGSAANNGDGGVDVAQMQRIHLLATVLIEVSIGVGTRLIVGLSVPSIASANNLRVGGMLRNMDGEMQGVHLLATVVVGVREGVGAALSVGAIVPFERLTSFLNEHFVSGMVHGEIERIHLFATVCIIVRIEINT